MKVKGPYCVKPRAITKTELIETFGGCLPSSTLTRPSAPAAAADAGIIQGVTIGVEPTDKMKRHEKWVALAKKYKDARDGEERRNADRAKMLEWEDFGDALPQRRQKRSRESNSDGERAAKRLTPDPGICRH
jgi:hypothetical protein